MSAAAPALAFILALALTALMLRTRWQWALDTPNERSLHDRPVPRTGGLAIMLGAACGFVLIVLVLPRVPLWAWTVGLPVLLLVLVSILDDRYTLSVRVRLPVHLLAATVFATPLVVAGGPVHWAWLPVLVIGVAGFANLYNFMDGANGLAGGMAVFGFSAYGIALGGLGSLLGGEAGGALGGGMGDPALAALCFALAAAAAGFLCFNLSGRIFMGDAGSVPLGFLAAALGVYGWAAGHWPCWFPLIVFAPFAFDGSVTVLKRMIRGERFWEAHRQHYYQRLVRMGLTHLQLAVREYALMAVCAGAALYALEAAPPVLALIFATIPVLFATLALIIDRRWRHFDRPS